MISDSVHSIYPLNKAVEGKCAQDRTPEETDNLKKYTSHKQHEKSVFKFLHSHVVEDTGLPTLKKTAYSMPGYRKVTSDRGNHDFDTITISPLSMLSPVQAKSKDKHFDLMTEESTKKLQFQTMSHTVTKEGFKF